MRERRDMPQPRVRKGIHTKRQRRDRSCKDSMAYLEAVVAFTTAVFLFHTWLDFRQLRVGFGWA